MPLQLIEYTDPRSFQSLVTDHLLQAEAENCIQFGLIGWMAREGYSAHSAAELDRPLLWTVQDGSGIELVAMQTLKNAMLVSRGSENAAEFLADQLVLRSWQGDALDCIHPASEALSLRYALKSSRPRRLEIELRVFELRQVRPPAPAAGQMRYCAPEDREVLAHFIAGLDADIGRPNWRDALAEADRLIARRRACLWVDREPAAMALWGGETLNGVRVTAVYTRPESRGRGYASSLVSTLSQDLLDRGHQFCFIIADKANPVSNGIYEKIGYVPVCDRQRWDFSGAAPSS